MHMLALAYANFGESATAAITTAHARKVILAIADALSNFIRAPMCVQL